MNPKNRNGLKAYIIVSSFFVEAIVMAAIGFAIGYALDYILNTVFVFKIIFIIIGVFAGVHNLIKKVSKLEEDDGKQE
ncbi:MAG: AtpZ/AtpI family protein [Candidatus Izemoplasmataceae bacterium]